MAFKLIKFKNFLSIQATFKNKILYLPIWQELCTYQAIKL